MAPRTLEIGDLRLVQRHDQRWRGRCVGIGGCGAALPEWVRTSLPAYGIAVPINMATWGVSPNLSNFAAAHAGCSCDPANPAVNLTYRVAISLAFTAMPLAGLLSYLRPTHCMRKLRALALVQAVAFMLVLAAATLSLIHI